MTEIPTNRGANSDTRFVLIITNMIMRACHESITYTKVAKLQNKVNCVFDCVGIF